MGRFQLPGELIGIGYILDLHAINGERGLAPARMIDRCVRFVDEAAHRLRERFVPFGRQLPAVASFQRLVADHPAHPRMALALLGAAAAREALGDIAGALTDYEGAAARVPELADHARLARGRLLLALGAPTAARDDARWTVVLTPTLETLRAARRLEIEALAALGDTAGALVALRDEIEGAAGSAARAGLLWEQARIMGEVGDSGGRRSALLDLVRDHARTSSAPGALDALLREASGAVRPYLEGRVRFYQRRNQDALAAFQRLEAATPTGAEVPWAQYYTAIIYERQGRDQAALDLLVPGARRLFGKPGAGGGDLGTGLVAGGAGTARRGSGAFWRLPIPLPRFGAGRGGAVPPGVALVTRRGAAQRGCRLGRGEPEGTRHPLRGRTALWRDKALHRLGDTAAAAAAWRAAAAARHGRYYAQRGEELGGVVPASGVARVRPEVSPAEVEGATAWVAGWSGGPRGTAVVEQVEASTHVVRGDLLAALGRNEAAMAEYRAAVAAFQTRPTALLVLARRLHARGWHWPAIQAATLLWERAPVASPAELPRGVRGLLYPAPYWDVVKAASERHGVDPWLLLALIRQESRFTPWVGSGAGALGLAQIMPATGQEIARGLGRGGYSTTDLYQPQVSIDFGAYHLGRQIRSLGGRVPLAAYNGGAGNALRWAGRDLAVDQDLFLESIDYEETALCVRIALEDYWHYRMLYGGGPGP